MTSLLRTRWDGLRRLPRYALAELPTPVDFARGLSRRLRSEVWIKRDDLTSPRYGGNKTRKLEYLLADARSRRADRILTVGAAGSHHVLATSLFAPDFELPVEAILFPQPSTIERETHLRAALQAGARLHAVRSVAALPMALAALSLRRRIGGGRPYVIPAGGSSEVGMLGQVEAGLELASQIDGGQLPEPAAIFVAYGTGGTAAGLAIGLAAAGLTSRIVAVRVVDPVLAHRAHLHAKIATTVRLLRKHDARFPDVTRLAQAHIHLEERFFPPGYGRSNPETRDALRTARDLAELTLDPTYTAKAMAALLRYARGDLRGQTLLYIHTLSSADLNPIRRNATPLPPRLTHLLQRV